MDIPMKRSMLLCLIILFANGIAIAALPSLQSYLWENRVILLFAPNSENPEVQQALELIKIEQCNVKDRDLVIGAFYEKGINQLDHREVSATIGREFREYYRVKSGFTAILVGKDGGEKFRTTRVLDLQSVFDLIDTMPMRQNEMAAKSVDCLQ